MELLTRYKDNGGKLRITEESIITSTYLFISQVLLEEKVSNKSKNPRIGDNNER